MDTLFQGAPVIEIMVLHPIIHVQADGPSLEQHAIMGMMQPVIPIIIVLLEAP